MACSVACARARMKKDEQTVANPNGRTMVVMMMFRNEVQIRRMPAASRTRDLCRRRRPLIFHLSSPDRSHIAQRHCHERVMSLHVPFRIDVRSAHSVSCGLDRALIVFVTLRISRTQCYVALPVVVETADGLLVDLQHPTCIPR